MSKLIALCGIDGTGKSTQAALLEQRLSSGGRSVKVLWCRWDPLLARPAIRLLDRLARRRSTTHDADLLERAPGNSRRRDLKRRLLSAAPIRLLWRCVMVLDYGIQVAPKVARARSAADIVIVDRYRHDVLIDLSAGGPLQRTPRALRWMLPEPDLIVVLDVDEDVALARKPDSPDLQYLRERRILYRELTKARSAVLIAADGPTADVSNSVMDAVASHVNVKAG